MSGKLPPDVTSTSVIHWWGCRTFTAGSGRRDAADIIGKTGIKREALHGLIQIPVEFEFLGETLADHLVTIETVSPSR